MCKGTSVGGKKAKIILLALFKCHSPGRETFHMIPHLHLQAFQVHQAYAAWGGKGGTVLGKPCG